MAWNGTPASGARRLGKDSCRFPNAFAARRKRAREWPSRFPSKRIDVRCLNCGAPLNGTFCAECGQRVVPPHPTVRELAGDAWHELTGYDGRIMATLRGLARPGFLTQEYLGGRRAHYLPPVRVYLIVSVIYFVIAASVPDDMAIREDGSMTGPGGVKIITETGDGAATSDQDRAGLLAQAETAPWYVRPMFRALAEDPSGFRARMLTIMPRVFVGLLPVF